MLMPFGRFRGCPLSMIPTDYLDWLDLLPDLRPRLRAALDAELLRRSAPHAAESQVTTHTHTDEGSARPLAEVLATGRQAPPAGSCGVVVDFATARRRVLARRAADSLLARTEADQEADHRGDAHR